MSKHYFVNDHVSLRTIDQEYLVYSGNVRETMLVDEAAYEVVLFLQDTPRNYQEIVDRLKEKNKEVNKSVLTELINMTLKQFIDCGVISIK